MTTLITACFCFVEKQKLRSETQFKTTRHIFFFNLISRFCNSGGKIKDTSFIF